MDKERCMSLTIVVEDSEVPKVSLAGRLDTHTAPQLDAELARLLSERVPARLVFDLGELEYLSSAGIRCFVRARKVLEIVKAMPPGGIFSSIAELDAYLDDMQRKIREGE